MCSTCVSGALRAQRRTSYPLELELEMAVSFHLGPGTKPKSSERAAASPMGPLSSPRRPGFQTIHFTESSQMSATHSFVARTPREQV